MKVRVCPHCGKNNLENVVNCIDCGTTLSINTLMDTESEQFLNLKQITSRVESNETTNKQTSQGSEESKVIITCEKCGQKLRVPLRRKNLHVACPQCRHEFNYEFVEGSLVSDSSEILTPSPQPNESYEKTSNLSPQTTEKVMDQALVIQLQNGSPQQRRAASYKMGKSRDSSYVPYLIKAYSDTDATVRQNVTDALQLIGTTEAIEFLKTRPTVSYQQPSQTERILCPNCGFYTVQPAIGSRGSLDMFLFLFTFGLWGIVMLLRGPRVAERGDRFFCSNCNHEWTYMG